MRLNKKIKELHDLIVKHAPGSALIDFVERQGEYIVLYRDDIGRYGIQFLNSSGLYGGHYYANYKAAWMDFSSIR